MQELDLWEGLDELIISSIKDPEELRILCVGLGPELLAEVVWTDDLRRAAFTLIEALQQRRELHLARQLALRIDTQAPAGATPQLRARLGLPPRDPNPAWRWPAPELRAPAQLTLPEQLQSLREAEPPEDLQRLQSRLRTWESGFDREYHFASNVRWRPDGITTMRVFVLTRETLVEARGLETKRSYTQPAVVTSQPPALSACREQDKTTAVPIASSVRQTDCPTCVNGKVVCVTCKGAGRTRCGRCDQGQVKCTSCAITKNPSCPWCHGAGSTQCRHCAGTAQVPCETCAGSGQQVCPTCEGHQRWYDYQAVRRTWRVEREEAVVGATQSWEEAWFAARSANPNASAATWRATLASGGPVEPYLGQVAGEPALAAALATMTACQPANVSPAHIVEQCITLVEAEGARAIFEVDGLDKAYEAWFFGKDRAFAWLRDSPAHALAVQTFETAVAHREAGRLEAALAAAQRAAPLIEEAQALVVELNRQRLIRRLLVGAAALALIAAMAVGSLALLGMITVN